MLGTNGGISSLERWIEYCILGVVFFLPLSLNHDIASVFLVVGTFLWVGKMVQDRGMKLRQTPFDLLLALFVILAAASISVSPDPQFSFYNYYHHMGRYVMLYYLVINHIHSLSQVKRLIWAMLAAGVVVVGYGFYQYLYGLGFPNLFGIDNSALEWVDDQQFPELKVRVYSTWKNPNLLAGYLVILISLAAGLGLHLRSIKRKFWFGALTLAGGLCLVLTYSRGAWLSLVAVVLTYGLVYNRRVLWLLVALPFALLLGHEVFISRVLSIMNPADTSSALRFALWESTWAMIGDKPWLGIGWGVYWKVYPAYNFFIVNSNTIIFHAHNMYLQLAAEIGIPGLVVFVSLLWGHIQKAYFLATNLKDPWLAGLMTGVLAALIGIAVGGLTDYVLYNMQLAMIFWLLCSLVVVCLGQTDRK